jgi:hypothetical protein
MNSLMIHLSSLPLHASNICFGMESSFFAIAVLIAACLFLLKLDDFLILENVAEALPLAMCLNLLYALRTDVGGSRIPSRMCPTASFA